LKSKLIDNGRFQMTKFDELRTQYKEWQDASFRYHMDCRRFTVALAKGFSNYLTAPETYRTVESREEKPYISPMETKIDEDTGDIRWVAPPSSNLSPDLYRDEDGYFWSGVAVVLDAQDNSEPKTRFMYQFRFILDSAQRAEILPLHDEGKQFSVELNDLQSALPLYNDIEQTLRAILKRKPWEMPEKRSMGFTDLKLQASAPIATPSELKRQ
jgi:hypothetical protein